MIAWTVSGSGSAASSDGRPAARKIRVGGRCERSRSRVLSETWDRMGSVVEEERRSGRVVNGLEDCGACEPCAR